MKRTPSGWGRCALALTITGVLCTQASAIKHTYRDTTSAFRQTITDPTGVAEDDHNAFNNMANWEVNTSVSETDQVNDELLIGWVARHLNPPHGEGPNPVGYLDDIRIDADDYAEGKGYTVTRTHVMGHGDHFDKFIARVTFDVTSTVGVDQITNWTFVFVGAHTETIYGQIDLTTTLVSSNSVPPNSSPAVGNCVLDYDNLTGRFGVSIAINGISNTQILGATLNIGPPGQNGTPIANLGSRSDWLDMDNGSTCLMLDTLQTQPQLAALMKRGMVYVNVMTTNFPQGEIRGHLKLVLPKTGPRP